MPVPEDFTLAAYRELLLTGTRAGYAFVRFSELRRAREPFCLLRHDVDCELLGCGPMLDAERDAGVKATYFLMVRSTAYNLFSLEARSVVARMLRDGHEIGLHFMGEGYASSDREKLVRDVLREARWLEAEFDTKVTAVSFHQPSKWLLEEQPAIEGLVNTYRRDDLEGSHYVSDTNMQWRADHPAAIFRQRLHARLQLLVHPIWWTRSAMSTREKWAAVLTENAGVVAKHWQERERTLAGEPPIALVAFDQAGKRRG